MKKIFIFGMLAMFAYAGFRPPEGMRKFPVANLQFEVSTPQGTVTATVQGESLMSTAPVSDAEEESL